MWEHPKQPWPHLSQGLSRCAQVPHSASSSSAQESQVTSGHSYTALTPLQEVSKPTASTNTASQQPDLSIINVNQLSADRGSINEARALSRSFMDLQLPRNESTQETNSGHSISAKAQGILLRISDSRIRKGSICSAGQKRCDRRSLHGNLTEEEGNPAQLWSIPAPVRLFKKKFLMS